MTLKTSTHFASSYADGEDWRDTSKAVLEELQSILTPGHDFTLGFLYITDELQDDATSILNLFKSVTGIENWVGCAAAGVFASQSPSLKLPGLAAMIGRVPQENFTIFSGGESNEDLPDFNLEGWLSKNDPFCSLVHVSPGRYTSKNANKGKDVSRPLENLGKACDSFIVGGVCSVKDSGVQFANDIHKGGISGVLFTPSQGLITGLTQGCTPIGRRHRVTRTEGNLIHRLDGEPAFQVLTDDIRDYAKGRAKEIITEDTILKAQKSDSTKAQILKKDKKDRDKNEISDDDNDDDIPSIEDLEGRYNFPGGISAYIPMDDDPGEYEDLIRQLKDIIAPVKQLFEGRLHLAMTLRGTDRYDYLARTIVAMDPDRGWISTGAYIEEDDEVTLARRDVETMREDLSRMLLDMRQRYQKEYGESAPKGGIYISCGARYEMSDEIELINEIIGDIPLVGYYAGGEISNGRLYGHTGILVLFG